jgi:hypothetical protein
MIAGCPRDYPQAACASSAQALTGTFAMPASTSDLGRDCADAISQGPQPTSAREAKRLRAVSLSAVSFVYFGGATSLASDAVIVGVLPGVCDVSPVIVTVWPRIGQSFSLLFAVSPPAI